MNTILIVGGSQKSTLEKIGKKRNIKVLYHDAWHHKRVKKEFKILVPQADAIVFQLGALSHVTMEVVKELAKKYNIPFQANRGTGATNAINIGIDLIQSN